MPTAPAPRPLRAAVGLLGRLAPDLVAAQATRFTFRPWRRAPRPWEVEASRGAVHLRLPGPAGATPGLEWSATQPRGTVLLVHGWEGRATQFGPLGLRLAQDGWRAVAVEMVGHGRAASGPSTPESWVETLLQVAAELGPLHGLVAHSLGTGPTLLALERGLRVHRLALAAPPSGLRPRIATAAADLGLVGRARERFLLRAERAILARGGAVDFLPLAARHAPPTLVLHAPDDQRVPIAEGRLLAAAIPDARFEQTAALGHNGPLRDPAANAAVVSFLSGGAPPRAGQ
jgi:hypothetical protein